MNLKLTALKLISHIFWAVWVATGLAALATFAMVFFLVDEEASFIEIIRIPAILGFTSISVKWLANKIDEYKDGISEVCRTNIRMSPENKQKAQRRIQIISDFGEFIESNPIAGEIRDASELPYSKEEILDAIFLQLVAEDDENLRSAMEAGAVMLADFQDGVGSEPLTQLGASTEQILQSTSLDEETIALAQKIAGNSDSEKYETFRAMVDEELDTIQAKILAAEQIREQIPLEKKRKILG